MQVAHALGALATVRCVGTSPDQQYRQERLRALAEHPDIGGRAALGRLLGYKDGAYVRQMIEGERAITEKLIHQVDTIRGGIYRGWFEKETLRGVKEETSWTPTVLGVAHTESQFRRTLQLPRVTWGQLMGVDLSQPFELEVVDDALGPDIYRGCVARLDPNRQPEAGRPVLVRDRTGAYYLRDYETAANGRWRAVARQRGYAPLDSEDDGLQLIATCRGFDWPL